MDLSDLSLVGDIFEGCLMVGDMLCGEGREGICCVDEMEGVLCL